MENIIDKDLLNEIESDVINGKKIEFKYIPVNLLEDNPKNKEVFKIKDIDSLSEDILCNGLMSPLLVYPLPEGNFMLLAGHRRKAAISKLLEQGYVEEFKEVPVVITREKNSLKLDLKLVSDNALQREKTNIEKIREIMFFRNIYEQMQAKGIHLEHPIIKLISNDIKISESQIKKLDLIGKRLIKELLDYIETGEIPISVAYELSAFKEQYQRLILKVYQNEEIIYLDEIQELKTRIALEIETLDVKLLIEQFVALKISGLRNPGITSKPTNVQTSNLSKSYKKIELLSKKTNSLIKDLRRKKRNHDYLDSESYNMLKSVQEDFNEISLLIEELHL